MVSKASQQVAGYSETRQDITMLRSSKALVKETHNGSDGQGTQQRFKNEGYVNTRAQDVAELKDYVCDFILPFSQAENSL